MYLSSLIALGEEFTLRKQFRNNRNQYEKTANTNFFTLPFVSGQRSVDFRTNANLRENKAETKFSFGSRPHGRR